MSTVPVLEDGRAKIKGHTEEVQTYRVLALLSSYDNERVMAFLNMYTEKVFRGEVLAAFVASICVKAIVMRLKLTVALKG
jgi:hypothetical protein